MVWLPKYEFDRLRKAWREQLTGGTAYNGSDPDISAQVAKLTARAQAFWEAMDKSPGEYLWSDLAGADASAHITGCYTRLREMALAYSTYTSALYNNARLQNSLLTGLDWMYQNRYNENKAQYGNWWDWQIGAPLKLLDIAILLYESLPSPRIADYAKAAGAFLAPISTFTGANRVWAATVTALRGVVNGNGDLLASARDALSEVFRYVNSGDGFYRDGSFIQHDCLSYNGGYGVALLGDVSALIGLLGGSPWAVTDPLAANVYRWVHDAFEPFIYKGALMDMTRGREICRAAAQDHAKGSRLIQFILRLSALAPAATAALYKSMVKYWIQTDTYRSFYEDCPIPSIMLAKDIMNDPAVIPRGELIANKPFNNMDRVVHLRPGFGYAVSMSSSRIANYESINGDNTRGWYTGDGMTYLYNGDLGHYSGDYWPTVNPYRLPGTTVDTMARADGSGQNYRSLSSWCGGVEIAGLYGTAAMSFQAWNSNLRAEKSWFMFDDEIVALGAGITNREQEGEGWDGDARRVETIIENRRLDDSGGGRLLVNGVDKTGSPEWAQDKTVWAHLSGSASGADIGYFFPGGATVKGLREARTGKWSSIHPSGSKADITRSYQTLWFDHGANPAGESYSYVLLPGKTACQVQDYAANPDIEILENSASAQAVLEKKLGVTGVVFLTDTLKWIQAGGVNFISSSKKALVMTRESDAGMEVAVSDPTQSNPDVISIEINRSASRVCTADHGVAVIQLSPSIKLDIHVGEAKGKVFKAIFA
ncbi:hyaluronate lyase [Paenibacillus sp. YN15]|nr:hyaluronate lyase [Paenibacillus sp. YN15]